MKFPLRELTNIDILKFAKDLKIPYFRGVFMRNDLPRKIQTIECGIVNLDNKENDGTHWTAYIKKNRNVIYFDSYGNLKPPIELISYFNSNGKANVYYTYKNRQKLNSFNCGQLSLKFVNNYIKGKPRF